MISSIFDTIPLSDKRTLIKRRSEGKRETTILIESQPIHNTAGVDFVHILHYRKFKNEALADIHYQELQKL